MDRKTKVSITHQEIIPGSPGNFKEDAIETVYQMLHKNIELIGGIEQIIKAGDKILLKVNACWPVSPESGIANDPRVVAALVRYLKKNTKAKSITLAERSSIGSDSFEALKKTGIYKVAIEEGVDKIIPLETDLRVKVRIPGAKIVTGEIHLPQCVIQADKIIYLAKLKTHKISGVTLAMKLTQGILPWSEIFQFHRRDIEQKIIDLLRMVKPDLSIIDGLWAMQGQGPGSPYKEDLIKNFNTIIAGIDPVAVDSIASSIMGFDPMFEIATVRGATNEGLGEGRPENIEVLGEDINKLKKNFKRGYISLIGLHPKIQAYVSASCKGCCHFTRTGLEPWLADQEKMKDFDKVNKITLIVGKNKDIEIKSEHNPPNSYTFVIGDCAQEHKDRGIFLPGCPSLSLHGLMPFIGLTDEEIEYKYKSRIPKGFTP